MEAIKNEESIKPDTTCIPRGYTPGNGEPRVVPIVQSTTYTYESSKEMGDLFDLQAEGFFCTRLANPTLDAVEKKIAALEGAWAPCSPPRARPPTSWPC
mgnify:CR=1 FL=1